MSIHEIEESADKNVSMWQCGAKTKMMVPFVLRTIWLKTALLSTTYLCRMSSAILIEYLFKIRPYLTIFKTESFFEKQKRKPELNF